MSSCTTCGVTYPAASSSVCPRCNPQEFAMVEVERRNSTSPCLNVDDICDDTDKWFDLTTQPFSIPAVNSSIDVAVCDPTRYAVGQWVYIVGAGLLQITALNSSTITLRNSCLDASAIIGNQAPSILISSGAMIWVVGAPGWPECLSTSGLCAETVACIAAAADICFSAIADADEIVEHNLFGGTVSDNCIKTLPNVFGLENALGYRNRAGVAGAKSNVSGTPTAKPFVVNDPATKLDQPLSVANNANGMWKYVDGDLVFVDGATLFVPVFGNILSLSNVNLSSGSTSHITSLLPSFPAGASQVMLHVQVWAITLTSNDFFRFRIKIGGREVLIYGANEQYASGPGEPIVKFPGHNDTAIIIPVSSDAALTIDNEVSNPSNDGDLDLEVWVMGYYV